jgi:polyhydroxyalkanoate synthesis regulator phasin
MAKVTVAERTIDRIKDGFEGARLQLVDLEKKVAGLPKEAKKKVGEVQKRIDEVPAELKGAWEHVVVRLRSVLDYASRDDLNALAEQVEELSKKVEKLVRGDKIRSAAEKKETKPAKKA